MLATALVMVAALLHAAWNTLIKFSAERLLVVSCMDSVAMLFVALMLPFVALPPSEIWPWILASAAFELLYRYLLIQALRRWSHPLDYLVWVTRCSAPGRRVLRVVQLRFGAVGNAAGVDC